MSLGGEKKNGRLRVILIYILSSAPHNTHFFFFDMRCLLLLFIVLSAQYICGEHAPRCPPGYEATSGCSCKKIITAEDIERDRIEGERRSQERKKQEDWENSFVYKCVVMPIMIVFMAVLAIVMMVLYSIVQFAPIIVVILLIKWL